MHTQTSDTNFHKHQTQIFEESVPSVLPQDASVQLPASHVLPYATVEETAMKTSLMTAFESSIRISPFHASITRP